MKATAIIQARMGSTRLPGKVLKDVCGETMLARVVHRVQRAVGVESVVVVTSSQPTDSPIVEECGRLGIPAFRGSEEDVLDRYYGAARAYLVQTMVRITGDCPLIDPEVIDQVLDVFEQEQPDYVCNFIPRTYPRGLDTEVLSMATLERTWREARKPYQRAHVTPYIYEHPEVFTLRSVIHDRDYSCYRWTVDTPEDLALVREVYGCLGKKGNFGWEDILALLVRRQDLLELNREVRQKALYEG